MAKKANDFELSDEAKAAGLRIGPNERISDEDRAYAKVKNEKLDNTSIVDKYRNFSTHPEAKSFPVVNPQKTELKNLEDQITVKPSSLSKVTNNSELSENERLGNMVKKLGGNRVGFIPPEVPLNKPDKNMQNLLSNKKGGIIKKSSGGVTRSSASKRADGCAKRGFTRA
jgi:hypothetical protein